MAAPVLSPPAPVRRTSFGQKISALGTKLGRSLSSHDSVSNDSQATLFVPLGLNTQQERSTSRGRDAFQSSGRGGLGNIRPTSVSRDRPTDGPDDFTVTRGREAVVNPNNVYSTGRGGAGNIRSPSRDPTSPQVQDSTEQDIIRQYAAANEGAVHSSGRGGLGNINRSRSREPHSATAPPPAVHSTGRGGAGNIVAGYGGVDVITEEERNIVGHAHDGIHSTGRGGLANLSSGPAPPVEHIPRSHREIESTGRGGSGNIRDRSKSRGRN